MVSLPTCIRCVSYSVALVVAAFVSSALAIIQSALSQWEDSVTSNSDELHLQMVDMHQHIWSGLQHQAADMRYNCGKWESDLVALDEKIKMFMQQKNFGEAKKLKTNKDEQIETIAHERQVLLNMQLQIDAVEAGTAQSYKILEQRGKPQEHPWHKTQLAIIEKQDQRLAGEQTVLVNNSTELKMCGLLDQQAALVQLRSCIEAGASGEDSAVALVGQGVSCWAQIPTTPPTNADPEPSSIDI